MTTFFDTNVFVYAFTEGRKRDPALFALAGGGKISVQVLNELSNVLRKKYHKSWDEITAALDVVRIRFPAPSPITVQTHERALRLARDHGFSLYDGLIVSAAIEAGCDTLLTEDMQDGRTIEGVAIRNPFLPPP